MSDSFKCPDPRHRSLIKFDGMTICGCCGYPAPRYKDTIWNNPKHMYFLAHALRPDVVWEVIIEGIPNVEELYYNQVHP